MFVRSTISSKFKQVFSNQYWFVNYYSKFQRTSPTEKDRQIQSSLGDFQCLKQLIERDNTHGSRLVGVTSTQMRTQSSFPLPIISSLQQQQQTQQYFHPHQTSQTSIQAQQPQINTANPLTRGTKLVNFHKALLIYIFIIFCHGSSMALRPFRSR